MSTTQQPRWRRWLQPNSREHDVDDSNSASARVNSADRGIAAASSQRSLSSRVGQLLGFALIGGLTLSALIWYYAHHLVSARAAERQARATTTKQAQGDTTLPPLGTITPPKLAAVVTTAPNDSASASTPNSHFLIGNVLGDPADAELSTTTGASDTAAIINASHGRSATASANAASNARTPTQLALERALTGNVFARSTPQATITAPLASRAAALDLPGFEAPAPASASEGASSSPSVNASSLHQRLQTVAAVNATASLLPTQRLLLPKGSFIDCTLETAIDSTLPGLTTCITAVDTFSADGTVVLMERGSKLVGETQGDVGQGRARLFVLWTEARTPKGVVIPLASPGTDELGRSGLPGRVDRHFFDRFGAALLISVIDGAIHAAAANQAKGSDGTTVVLNPSGSQDILTEVLKSSVSIPPTITKRNGDRIQILVARDIDFRSVYSLQAR
jgi:type IV secretion system protein VirB10